MKGVLKFLGLVVLLAPAWIAFLTLTGEDRLKQQMTVGPLAAVDQALQGAETGSRVSGMTRMDPTASANGWRLEGLATVPGEAGVVAARPFVAAIHTKCPTYSDAACWAVDRLDFPADGEVSAPATQAAPEGDGAVERLLIVQDQLRDLGFDPGSADGVMGLKTRQAIRDYDTALALGGHHAMAYHSRGNARFDIGDYWGAVAEKLWPAHRGRDEKAT